MTDNTRGVSALDRAHGMRLAGDVDGALRLSTALLQESDFAPGAAGLVARLLLDADHAVAAGEAAERLVEAYVRRGDLAAAVIAAQLGLEAGGYADHALRHIAEAFGKGSTRVADVAPAPPPLPRPIQVSAGLAKLSGEALRATAEKALSRFAKTKDPQAADTKLPRLPLFSALEPVVLVKLLGLLELRELAAKAHAIRQGEPGHEAFVLARGVLNVVRAGAKGDKVLAALGPGSIFGEMALVSDAPRAASVVAVEPAQLLVVSRAHLEALAQRDPTISEQLGNFCHGRMLSNLVRHSAILSAVEPAKRKLLIERFTTHRFQAGDAMVRQGEEAGCLWLIASGGVEVRSTDDEGDRVVLAELGPGDVVGEISMVLRRPANADVVAVHHTVALELTHERFSEAIREHPELLRELYDIATQREAETRSVVAQEALDVSDVVLL